MEIQNKHKIKLFHGPLVWHLLPSFHALQCTWILYTGVQYFTSSGPSLAMSLGPKKLTSYFQLKWSHPSHLWSTIHVSVRNLCEGFFQSCWALFDLFPCLPRPQVFQVQCIQLNWVHTDCSEPPDIVQDALMSWSHSGSRVYSAQDSVLCQHWVFLLQLAAFIYTTGLFYLYYGVFYK